MRLIRTIVLITFLFFAFASPVSAQEERVKVYYAGDHGSVLTALNVAKFQLVDDINQADVIVLNGSIPDAQAAGDRLREGAGVVLVLGPDITPAQLDQLAGWQNAQLAPLTEPVTLAENSDADDRIIDDILWNTSPQAAERQSLSVPEGGPPTLVSSHDTGELLLGRQDIGGGQLFVITPTLDGDNTQFREWGFYNYLLYNIVTRAAGRQPVSFGEFSGSPVPHPQQRQFLYTVLGVILVIAVTAYLLVRSYSRAHPEALDTLVRNPKAFEAREAGTDWEKIGFHRPLGGFMFALMAGIFLFIPLVVYQDMILPVYILPSAQALGIYGRVAAFFPLVWAFFDMGTSVAHMKYFSEYRVKNPRRAVQYAQFYVWWQALTGALQVALVVGVVGTFLPNTTYALFTWAVITHTMIQIPGFYRLFTDAFSGIQRSDYGTILDMGINLVFPMVAQAVLVSLMVYWGRNNPVFGPAMGGVFGMGIAAYATELMSFIFGFYLYRRLGYNPRLLMMAHFDWSIAKDSLSLGVFLFLGGLVSGIGSMINVTVVQSRLLNNNEILGNIAMASSFVFAFTVFQALTGAMMPSISEAISNGRKILAQYYSGNGYKYGAMISAFLLAILLAVADRFILGSSGPTFARAAVYVVPLLIIGALQFAPWNADMVINGTGKTRLTFLLATIDLFLGVGLAYLVVDRFQAAGLLAVPFITTPVRIFLSYWMINHFCFPQKIYAWQTVAAPLLAGAVHFLIVRSITGFIWQNDEITSIVILVLALIFSLPLYAFLYGLAGGWDNNTLSVFDRGTRMASFMRPFARMFYRSTALGARISPLHGRFPFANHDAAIAEAESLTAERVSLVQREAPPPVFTEPAVGPAGD